MTENSDNPEKSPKSPEEVQQPPEELPEKPEGEGEAEEVEPATPAPKAKGRPRGSRDSAPRVKRVPVVLRAPPEQVRTRPAPKQVRVSQPEPEEQVEEEQEEPQQPQQPEPKSPRTLRKEHMQALANHRRAQEQARQSRFDHLLDRFMGY